MRGFTNVINSQSHGKSLYSHRGKAPTGEDYVGQPEVYPVVLSYEHHIRRKTGTTFEERLPLKFWEAVINRALALAHQNGKCKVAIWIDSILQHEAGEDWIEAGLLPYMKFPVLYIVRPGIRMSYWIWLEEMMAIAGEGKSAFYYNGSCWEEEFITSEDIYQHHKLPTVAALVLDSVDPSDFETWSDDAARLRVWALGALLNSKSRAHAIIVDGEPISAAEIVQVCKLTNIGMPRSSASKIRMAREHIGRRAWSGDDIPWNLPLMLLPEQMLNFNLPTNALIAAHRDLQIGVSIKHNRDVAIVDMQTDGGRTRIHLRFTWKDGTAGCISESRISYMPSRVRQNLEDVLSAHVNWTQGKYSQCK